MKLVKYLFFAAIFCAQTLSAQYYNAAQINTINVTRAAFEGDFYLDTVARRYYIGITNGTLLEIGVKVDSLKISNDSLRLFQGSREIATPINVGADNSFDITQSAHGLTVPSWGILPLSYNHATNLYEPAQANSIANSSSLLAVQVVNPNTLKI